jgi:hypothetical protein
MRAPGSSRRRCCSCVAAISAGSDNESRCPQFYEEIVPKETLGRVHAMPEIGGASTNAHSYGCER